MVHDRGIIARLPSDEAALRSCGAAQLANVRYIDVSPLVRKYKISANSSDEDLDANCKQSVSRSTAK
jgi:hypothetical protein